MSLQESGEMYLETIYVLSKESSTVLAIDIGNHLGYSKPSVSRALGLLKEKGYIEKSETGGIKLTKDGEKIAKTIYERHSVLSTLFMNLGVDKKTAVEDACRIEHYISEKTFKAIKAHMAKYSKADAK
ncbi:MAG: metal-dependent transcriptional regulator [Treponema sp.]|nr:metal-dependent transcriptional regulator [Treponema sp.]